MGRFLGRNPWSRWKGGSTLVVFGSKEPKTQVYVKPCCLLFAVAMPAQEAEWAGLIELHHDVLSCLHELSGQPRSETSSSGSVAWGPSKRGGKARADTGADNCTAYPAAWLLCDLASLLPPNSRLAKDMLGHEPHLCSQLASADRNDKEACRQAAVLMEAFSTDSFAARELAHSLATNPAMRRLCLAAAQTYRRRLAPAVEVIGKAAWQLFSQRVATLQATERSSRFETDADWRQHVAAAAAAIRAMDVATRLISSSPKQVEHALQHHGESMTAAFKGGLSVAASGSFSHSSELFELLQWWAVRAQAILRAADRFNFQIMHRASLGIVGESHLPTTLASCWAYLQHVDSAFVPSPAAELFLDDTITKLLQSPGSSTANLAVTLNEVTSCAEGEYLQEARFAARDLLANHEGPLMQLVNSNLHPPTDIWLPAAVDHHAAIRLQQTADELVRLAGAAFRSVMAAGMGRARLKIPYAMRQVLHFILNTSAGHLDWLPDRQRNALRNLSCTLLAQLGSAASVPVQPIGSPQPMEPARRQQMSREAPGEGLWSMPIDTRPIGVHGPIPAPWHLLLQPIHQALPPRPV